MLPAAPSKRFPPFPSLALADATANGGAFDFYVDPAGDGSMAVPLQQEFWEWLLTSAVTEWGLTTYEQECVQRLAP